MCAGLAHKRPSYCNRRIGVLRSLFPVLSCVAMDCPTEWTECSGVPGAMCVVMYVSRSVPDPVRDGSTRCCVDCEYQYVSYAIHRLAREVPGWTRYLPVVTVRDVTPVPRECPGKDWHLPLLCEHSAISIIQFIWWTVFTWCIGHCLCGPVLGCNHLYCLLNCSSATLDTIVCFSCYRATSWDSGCSSMLYIWCRPYICRPLVPHFCSDGSVGQRLVCPGFCFFRWTGSMLSVCLTYWLPAWLCLCICFIYVVLGAGFSLMVGVGVPFSGV